MAVPVISDTEALEHYFGTSDVFFYRTPDASNMVRHSISLVCRSVVEMIVLYSQGVEKEDARRYWLGFRRLCIAKRRFLEGNKVRIEVCRYMWSMGRLHSTGDVYVEYVTGVLESTDVRLRDCIMPGDYKHGMCTVTREARLMMRSSARVG